ncbi:MAG: hypothetical protein IJH63_02220 [Methanobrevibacter sp.]|nr:hypothetical protein [Methanobrevibacter sp.]MBR0369523.1 hypothetical protein [Methanobrevibacter sp.]
MVGDVKCLRILKEGISLKDIFKDEFLNKLNDNFEDLDIFPVGVAFVLKNGEITEDMINLTYRNDEDINNDILLIDVNNNPDNMDFIKKSLE